MASSAEPSQPSPYLTQEMRTNSAGTVHTWMPGSLNSHESRNTYAWQTLGTPAGSTNGTADLLKYTVTDIWYKDSPIYNIETISDSAVLYSHTASQRYDQYYLDVWAAIHNNPNLDAILW